MTKNARRYRNRPGPEAPWQRAWRGSLIAGLPFFKDLSLDALRTRIIGGGG